MERTIEKHQCNIYELYQNSMFWFAEETFHYNHHKTLDEISLIEVGNPTLKQISCEIITILSLNHKNFTVIIHWFFSWKLSTILQYWQGSKILKNHIFESSWTWKGSPKPKMVQSKAIFLRLGLFNSDGLVSPTQPSSICKHLLQQIKTNAFWSNFFPSNHTWTSRWRYLLRPNEG